MRILLLGVFLISTLGVAQDYLDVLTVRYKLVPTLKFNKPENSSTQLTNIGANLVFPIKRTAKSTFVMGVDLSDTRLSLVPQSPAQNLQSATLQLGLLHNFSERWSATFALLPKWASGYNSKRLKDTFLGGYFLLKQKKNDNLSIGYGGYASTEAFGVFATPIIGVYYKSPSKQFEASISFPVDATLTYQTTPSLAFGLTYAGVGRSYPIPFANTNAYVQEGALDFSVFAQMSVFKNLILTPALGYTSSDFEVYNAQDRFTLGLSAFRFGDNRKRLNPSFKGTFFIRVEAALRLFDKDS